MDFKIVGEESLRTEICTIDSSVVIESGDLCEMASGLPIKATATGTSVAFAPLGSANGSTQVELTVGNDFILTGQADTNFAVANKGAEVDLVVNSNVQQIDLGSSATDVLKVSFSENAGVVGSAEDISVKIFKPIF